jgi:uncharacterized protein with HEPN domain
VTPLDLRSAALTILAVIDRVHEAGRAAYDESDTQRFALQRLWIALGECSERFRRRSGVPRGQEPYRVMAGFRNFLAHALPDEVSAERVWSTSRGQADQVRAFIEDWRH